jgi:hypothetical protein
MDVPWTYCAGNGAASKTKHPSRVVEKSTPCNGGSPLAVIRYQHETKWCVPYGLFNVLQTSKTKAKLTKKTLGTSLCGFADLADRAAGVLGVSLKKIKYSDVSWLLKQNAGKFLLLKGVHCISVDCDKDIVYDCAKTHELNLSRNNLKKCGFRGYCEIRQVI